MSDLEASQASSLKRRSAPELQVLDSTLAPTVEENEPSYGRVAIVSAIALTLLCFVAFQHGDLLHTASCALSMLRGHLRDFYDYNTGIFGGINYLPSTYLLYALVGLPIKLFHHLPNPGWPSLYYGWYYKAFNTLAYLGTAVHIRAIALRMNAKPQVATFAAVLWLTTPVAFFSQFIFGQYDILTLFLLMWGIRCYMKGRLAPFTALVAVALTFKYFPLFCYLPLLLLAEKRITHLLTHGAAVALPVIIESLFYRHSIAFQDGVFGFSVANYVFKLTYNTGGVDVTLVFLVWFSVCAYAWLTDCPDVRDKQRRALFVALAGAAPVFVLSNWHPQWAIFITPFLCLVAGLHANRRRMMVLDVVMVVGLYGYCCGFFPQNVDHALLHRGFFGRYNPDLASFGKVVTMLPEALMEKRSLFVTLFDAILLAYVWMSWPRRAAADQAMQPGDHIAQRDISGLWARFFVGVGIWVALAARSYAMTLRGV